MTRMNVNLYQAHNAFVSCIAAANQHHTDPAVLSAVYQEKLDRLDQYMDVLSQLASAGMEEQLVPLLTTLLQEWAIKEAMELLLHHQNGLIDPADQGLHNAFWEKLGRQHQALSCELFLQLQRGEEQRAQAQEERAKSWQAMALKAFESQCQQQQHWQGTAFQWVQHQQQPNQRSFENQREMFNHFQQANQQWANTAMVGVQQAQLGVKQWYDFAASTQASVANMLAGSEQRQAMVVEQAMTRANTKRWMSRLMIIGLVMLGMFALFACSFFAMMHLY